MVWKERKLSLNLVPRVFSLPNPLGEKRRDPGDEVGHHSMNSFDRGQTREICEKQENYFKGKVVTFTVQSLLLYQYPADLLTFLELY